MQENTAENHTDDSHAAGINTDDSHAAEDHTDENHTDDSHAAESHAAGTNTAGSHAAESHAAEDHTAGEKASSGAAEENSSDSLSEKREQITALRKKMRGKHKDISEMSEEEIQAPIKEFKNKSLPAMIAVLGCIAAVIYMLWIFGVFGH